jgi:ATPase subunit of ABC transporter with duplicated ATPase domains
LDEDEDVRHSKKDKKNKKDDKGKKYGAHVETDGQHKDHKDHKSAAVHHSKADAAGESDDDEDDDEVAEVAALDPDALTIEQKVRKEKPPSRIRFAESSQPDFAMMALEGVGLIYGNQVVIKDSSFSVATGERVGLVGPNGGGKVRHCSWCR